MNTAEGLLFAVGSRVRICKLAKNIHLNRVQATVFNYDGSRFHVKTEAGQSLALRADNLELVDHDAGKVFGGSAISRDQASSPDIPATTPAQTTTLIDEHDKKNGIEPILVESDESKKSQAIPAEQRLATSDDSISNPQYSAGDPPLSSGPSRDLVGPSSSPLPTSSSQRQALINPAYGSSLVRRTSSEHKVILEKLKDPDEQAEASIGE